MQRGGTHLLHDLEDEAEPDGAQRRARPRIEEANAAPQRARARGALARQGARRVRMAVRRVIVGVVVGRGLDRVARICGQQWLVDGVRAARRAGAASAAEAWPSLMLAAVGHSQRSSQNARLRAPRSALNMARPEGAAHLGSGGGAARLGSSKHRPATSRKTSQAAFMVQPPIVSCAAPAPQPCERDMQCQQPLHS